MEYNQAEKKVRTMPQELKYLQKSAENLLLQSRMAEVPILPLTQNSRIVLQKQRLQMYLMTTLKESSRKRQAMQIQQTTRLLHMRATVQTALP